MIEVFDPLSLVLFAQEGGGGVSPTQFLMPMIIIGLLFYFMILRPENRRRAEMQKLLQNIKKNDEVITVGGIYGVVVNAPQDSEFIYLRLDESTNTRVKVLRSSISRVLTAEKAAEKDKPIEKSEIKEK